MEFSSAGRIYIIYICIQLCGLRGEKKGRGDKCSRKQGNLKRHKTEMDMTVIYDDDILKIYVEPVGFNSFLP